MCINGNQGSKPNYEPSTFHQYKPLPETKLSTQRVTGLVGRFKPAHPNDDFSQPGALFRKVMQDQDKTNTVSNIVGHLKGANRDI